jgi:hypothetical protein
MKVLADSGYPVLDVMWTVMAIFLWGLYIWLLVMVYMDLFSRSDISGWAKAGWVILTLFVPLLGSFLYLVTQGRHMAERRNEGYGYGYRSVQPASHASNGAGSPVEQIAHAKSLLDNGAITPEEYATLKQKALIAQ